MMTHPVTLKLQKLMQKKHSNLCLSLDLTQKAEFLKLADLAGPEIVVLKTHIDIIEDFDADLITQLQNLATKHQFLIFEDRKFADIGETVKHQFSQGVYHISEWADIINAHGIAGPGIIDSLKTVAKPETGLLLLAQMSSKDNLLTPEYTKTIVSWADQHPEFVMGFIAQEALPSKHPFIVMSPGVHLDKTGDDQNQQFRTPEQAVVRDKCNIIIVGRGIYAAPDPLAEARRYKAAGWAAHQEQKKTTRF